tara:strand:+ start:1208 stop:1759 length:552 start_codon:yes stop_codon:yes gene_type:complete
MRKILFLFLIFFFFQNIVNAANKNDLIKKLSLIENISFNFIQTIGGKDEKGKCTIQYPKKIFCEYEKRNNKILVSNGKNLVIKNNKQYYRYPIKSTPLAFILDKNFLINKIKLTDLNEIEDKYVFIKIIENNNNISIFFNKKNYELVGWQIEDIYQNLAVTFIFDTLINQNIDQKIFKLPVNN